MKPLPRHYSRLVWLGLASLSLSATAAESSYDRIQWDKRGNDTFYCIDITGENFQVHPWLQALNCGENLYSFSPKTYLSQVMKRGDLMPGTRFGWRVWSQSGYGGEGYEGTVTTEGCAGQPYASSNTTVQWGCRGGDSFYCVDILDAQGGMVKQAAACNEGLHSFSPSTLNLAAGTYQWKIWSPGGYGAQGFEGQFSIAPVVINPAASGQSLFSQHCAGCHGSPNNIRSAGSAANTRSAINRNKGGMGYLNFLTDAQLNDIAAYVQNPNSATTPVTNPAGITGDNDNGNDDNGNDGNGNENDD